MAQLLHKEERFYREYLEQYKDEEPPDPQERAVYRGKMREFEWIRSNTREFGNRLAANPYFFDVMESWRVYIIGKEGATKESMMEAIKTDDVDDLIDRSSTLANSIKNHLRSKGYMICDMGAATDGWDMAVRCSEKKSRDLCAELHRKYFTAIDMGLIYISRRFAGHTLPGLYNWEDAKKILSILGGKNDSESEML